MPLTALGKVVFFVGVPVVTVGALALWRMIPAPARARWLAAMDERSRQSAVSAERVNDFDTAGLVI